MSRSPETTLGAVVVVVSCAVGGAMLAQRPASAFTSVFPAPLEAYFATSVHLTDDDRGRLQSGATVTRLLDSDPTHEVSVFGAVWVDAPPERYVRAITDIERFEHGGHFLLTKKISDPPRPEDFAALQVSDRDFDDLRQCQVSHCAVKLGQNALDRIQRQVHWAAPSARAEVDALMRQIVFEYANAYHEGGNSELAIYRDTSHPTFVANEFESMVGRMPELTLHLPEVRQYLLDYPRAQPEGSRSFLYWQNVVFGLKPTIRINHVVINESAQGTVVTSKMIYATHYFWTALELRVLVSDPARGRGFWLVTVNRSRSDGLSGFVGRLVRGTVHSETLNAMEATLRSTKQRIEGSQRP